MEPEKALRTKIPIDCPKCGEKPHTALRELIGKYTISCVHCGNYININSEADQASFHKEFEGFLQIETGFGREGT